MIEVEHMSMLYIFNYPNGVSVIVQYRAPFLQCFLDQGYAAHLLTCRKIPFITQSSLEHQNHLVFQEQPYREEALYFDGFIRLE